MNTVATRWQRTAALAATTSLAVACVLAVPGVAGAHAKAKTSKSLAKLEKELKAINSKVSSGQHKSFKATYSATFGQAQTFTFAQSPPKTLIKTGSGSVINNGKQTLFCSTSSGHATCIAENSATNPFAEIENLFSPSTAATFFRSAEVELAAKRAGYSVKFTSASIGGQKSNCLTVKGPSGSGRDCVNGADVLDYVGTSSGHLQMTNFSTSVPASTFTTPAGATVETLPAGVTVP